MDNEERIKKLEEALSTTHETKIFGICPNCFFNGEFKIYKCGQNNYVKHCEKCGWRKRIFYDYK